MAEQLGISTERLQAALSEHYGVSASVIEFLPLGLDANAAVYRVVGDDGAAYALKVRTGPIYTPSCTVPRYLRDQGITAVVAPLPTQTGKLWKFVDNVILLLYPFVAGVSGWEPGLKATQWQTVGRVMRQIHQAPLPVEGFAKLNRETFDPTMYATQMRAMDEQTAAFTGVDPISRALCADWLGHQQMLHHAMASLETLAATLTSHAEPLVICHADLHAGNIIRTEDGGVYLVDWDDVRLAPKERDFLFVGEPGESGQADAPFFAGYGPLTVNRTSLAYFRWERDVQDVLVSAEIILNRTDVTEATRATELRVFQSIIANGMTDPVRAAMETSG